MLIKRAPEGDRFIPVMLRRDDEGNFLVVPWLRLCALTAHHWGHMTFLQDI